MKYHPVTTSETAIRLARKHLGNGAEMETSARVCLADAIAHFDEGAYGLATTRALKSLAYSVGISHHDYRRIANRLP